MTMRSHPEQERDEEVIGLTRLIVGLAKLLGDDLLETYTYCTDILDKELQRMTDAEARRLRMHDPIWVDMENGGRRPDTAMSTEQMPPTPSHSEGRMMVETRMNGWKEADQVHHRPGDTVPGEPPKPPQAS